MNTYPKAAEDVSIFLPSGICARFLNSAKMQNIPEIPRLRTFQALKLTHSILRRPEIGNGPSRSHLDRSAHWAEVSRAAVRREKISRLWLSARLPTTSLCQRRPKEKCSDYSAGRP